MNDNSRYLEELIEHYKNNDKVAYLITLDAQKAFDSVDHTYMTNLLRLYNFPEEYIHWISTLYTGLNASILINGFSSDTIEIKQSVKQGDSLSCALFILSIEPLLRNIKNNSNIKAVKTTNLDEDEVKNFSYADDITALCENKEGIQEIINCYNTFTSFSGIMLNLPKTEILVIGKKTQSKESFKIVSNTVELLIHDQECVKICGITFSNNPIIAYTANVKDKILKLEGQLNIWRQRNLSLKGKILIVKTFGLSQLVYSMQATSFHTKELKLIEQILNFIEIVSFFENRLQYVLFSSIFKKGQ